MRYTVIILFLLTQHLCRATGGDTSFTRPATNRYTAAEEIRALKHGALVVRLKTNDKSIEAYRRAGKNELADKIVAERLALNQKISEAFRYYFKFCKVYFIYAKSTEALLKHEPNIFLNENLKPDSSIKLTENYFLIAEYGSTVTNERTDEYHYSGVYNTEPSTSTASNSALVIMDTTLTQLREPFPYTAAVYLGAFIKAVNQLDTQLDKAYYRFKYQEDLDREKLNKSGAPKK